VGWGTYVIVSTVCRYNNKFVLLTHLPCPSTGITTVTNYVSAEIPENAAS
jgi:hypothetical protein